MYGSEGGTRTRDQLVNSQLLYRLSYLGIAVFPLIIFLPLKSRISAIYFYFIHTYIVDWTFESRK